MEWLEAIKGQGHFYRDLAVVGVEIVAVILIYLLISGVAGLVARRAGRVTGLARYESQVRSSVRVFRIFLRLAVFLLLIGVVGLNGYQFYQGRDLLEYTQELMARIPPGFWVGLALSIIKLLGLMILARYLIRLLDRLLTKAMQWAVAYKQLRSNDESVTRFFERLIQIQKVAVWLVVLYIGVRLLGLPATVAGYILIALKVYLIVSIGLLIVNAVAAIVDSLDGLSMRYTEGHDVFGLYRDLRHLVPVFRRTLEYIVYAATATLVLSQLTFISRLAEYGPGVIQGIGVIFIARVVIEVINLLIDRRYLHGRLPQDERQRNETIYPIIKSVLAALVYFIAAVLVLRGLGFDPIPLLAGAGILGMVVGLGAQKLVNDIVSGFFIILENAFKVGDFIKVGDASGLVESIGLRTTRVRSMDGQQYILRNGALGDIVNYSRDYTNAVVLVGVDSRSDLDDVYDAILTVGKAMAEEVDDIVQATRIDGIDNFSGPELVIRTVTKVKPGRHNPVARALRQRIKAEFDTRNIIIPFDKRWRLA